ncbi:MAG: hypothetical protein QMD04_03950 [Anaerolineales bacterium]|nr:hypothetical protein [Anaerolineales bacterium]
MEFNLATILILLGVLLLGWVIGFLDANLRSSKKIKAAETQARIQIEAARAMAHSAEAQAKEPAIEATAGNNLLRLWAGTGQEVHLELDDQPIDRRNLTSDQRRRLIARLAAMRPWLEGGPAAPAAPASGPAPAAAVKTAEPVLPAVAKSIVAQINDVLQARLPGTPLAAKHVRLGETSGGGVLVYIGTTRYEGIDTVPDPDVVAAIRAAIVEWENEPK